MSKESLESAEVLMVAPRSKVRVLIPRGLVKQLMYEGWKEAENKKELVE